MNRDKARPRLLRAGARPRREGSALILVLFVMLMMTGMVLVLLSSAQTSHLQSRELVSLTQAAGVADAAMRTSVLRLGAGDVPTSGTPIVVTDQAFGGNAFRGQFDYRLSVVRTSPSRVFLCEAEGRVQTGAVNAAGEWTRSGVQVWIEEVLTGTPPAGAPGGALTVVSESGALPLLNIHKAGNPPEITGNDYNLLGGLNPGGNNVPAVATNVPSATWTGSGSPPGDILSAVLTATSPNPLHTSSMDYEQMRGFVEALRTISASTATSPLPDPNTELDLGTPDAPVVLKYELTSSTDATNTVSLPGGTQFYGLIIIKVPADWPGNTAAIITNGNCALHGMVYLEMESLGTDANSGTEIARLNGGGNETQVTGSMVMDVRSRGNHTAASKTIARLNGGGTGAPGIAYSTEGIDMVRNVVGTPSGASFRTIGYKTTGALGITTP